MATDIHVLQHSSQGIHMQSLKANSYLMNTLENKSSLSVSISITNIKINLLAYSY